MTSFCEEEDKMAESFGQNVNELFKGMENFITTKTVVGESVRVGDTTILPLVDVSFGMAASAKSESSKNAGGGGMGGKISPSALLIIQNGSTKLINIKNQDAVTKMMDMAPDLINRFVPGRKQKAEDPEVKKACDEVSQKVEEF